MPNEITITNITGSTPFDVYVCDITNTLCVFITGLTSCPPSYTFTVPSPLDTSGSLLIKIVDSDSCERFEFYSCVSPTPTPTPTPTPSPLPTNCNCVEAIALTDADGTLDFVDCLGIVNTSVPISHTSPSYFCASVVTSLSNVNIVTGPPCVSNLCV
jgi:hypothetical protein